MRRGKPAAYRCCPIDLDYNRASPQDRGFGWMLDDNRPVAGLFRQGVDAVDVVGGEHRRLILAAPMVSRKALAAGFVRESVA